MGHYECKHCEQRYDECKCNFVQESTKKKLKRDLSTKENRDFWKVVDRTAKRAKKGKWQKGAV